MPFSSQVYDVWVSSMSSAFLLYLTGSLGEHLRSAAHGEETCGPDGADEGALCCSFL